MSLSPDDISPAVHEFLTLDFAPLLAVTLSAGTLGVLGAFLVLRRRAMIGDALAHSVLPGLVIAFLITGTRTPFPMFMGAFAAAGLATLAISTIARFGRVDPSTSIGVVFTTLFALGILLVEISGARNVDIDLECVLSGQLELLFWRAPDQWSELFSSHAIKGLPAELRTIVILAALTPLVLMGAWRLIRLTTFDPVHARTRGLLPSVVQGALFVLTTMAIVASFGSLGSILVIALLICPAATARLVTHHLHSFVLLSGAIGVGCGALGYIAATRLAPVLLGNSVDASGTVAALSGAVLAVAAIRTARSHGSRQRSAHEALTQ